MLTPKTKDHQETLATNILVSSLHLGFSSSLPISFFHIRTPHYQITSTIPFVLNFSSLEMSKYTINPMLESDLPTHLDFLLKSKITLSINRFLFLDWPNEAAQKVQYTKAAKGGFYDDRYECLKVVDENGEMVAHLVLLRKAKEGDPDESDSEEDSKEEATSGAGQSEAGSGLDLEFLPNVMNAVREIEEERQGIEHFGKPPPIVFEDLNFADAFNRSDSYICYSILSKAWCRLDAHQVLHR